MKTLEELGISPTPWKNPNWKDNSFVFDANNLEVAIVSGDCKAEANANETLITAAPKMYKFLLDAVNDVCYGCRYEDDGECTNEDLDCHVKKWRAALAEASGEEVC